MQSRGREEFADAAIRNRVGVVAPAVADRGQVAPRRFGELCLGRRPRAQQGRDRPCQILIIGSGSSIKIDVPSEGARQALRATEPRASPMKPPRVRVGVDAEDEISIMSTTSSNSSGRKK